MSTENDAPITGGEELTLDEAASRFAALSTSNAADEGQAEDEDETEEQMPDDLGENEDEGEDETEGQADDEEDAEPETERGRYVAHNGRVKLPDGSESTIADLISGNLRDRDYRQKTMELAEQRRAAEAQSSSIKQLETQLAQEREFVHELLKTRVPQEPDLSLTDPNSPNFDPVAYQHKRAQYEQSMRELMGIQQQLNQANERKNAETEADRNKKAVAALEALVEAVPAYKDQTKLAKFFTDANTYGAEYGFSQQELVNGIGYDHRMAMVMRDAIAYRKLQAAKPKVQAKVEGRPPIQKGGARQPADAQRSKAASVAINRLKESGSVEDAARAFLATRKG